MQRLLSGLQPATPGSVGCSTAIATSSITASRSLRVRGIPRQTFHSKTTSRRRSQGRVALGTIRMEARRRRKPPPIVPRPCGSWSGGKSGELRSQDRVAFRQHISEKMIACSFLACVAIFWSWSYSTDQDYYAFWSDIRHGIHKHRHIDHLECIKPRDRILRHADHKA